MYIPEIKSVARCTNEYGFYSITLPEGNYDIEISYIGFQTITKKSISRRYESNFSLFHVKRRKLLFLVKTLV
jgi:hypothetical protein